MRGGQRHKMNVSNLYLSVLDAGRDFQRKIVEIKEKWMGTTCSKKLQLKCKEGGGRKRCICATEEVFVC
jgi:hypothetical protein